MQDKASFRVWDLVVRVTHWSVAVLVFWDLIEDSGGRLHRALGYVAAGLVLLRMLWGFVGSEHARFRAWVPQPAGVLAYSKALVQRRAPRFLSHTPLGAVMMLLMWALILALAVTGWMSRLDALWGEDWPIDIHGALADMLTALIIVHVLAAVVFSVTGKENLVLAMLTGRKRRNHDA
ncbi:cytochrome b/b6 domain-containing protein [Cupriavidus sp. WKF15]|uniref:cytochrome b/b6 domain-containing protein n=1 Tax=Cupriavidus sp. WKF15 TaxID=3032282 RepID=UPI0023E2161F|nr:cytochrome b/b6 domain-containing protein [Cupriavidus sp. WKF15]WER48750.1 cytochrome b/b6 domain-containing protein [Cupriavidus sp. WKF15]